MIFISLLYAFFVLYASVKEYSHICKNNRIEMVSIIRMMYILFQGFIPMLVYFKSKRSELAYSANIYELNVFHAVLCAFFSITGYFLFELGFHTKQRSKKTIEGQSIEYDYHKIRIISIVSLFVGIMSLLLWTKAYGSVTSFMQNAARIRSGYGTISNKLAFFKHYAKLVNVAAMFFCPFFIYDIINHSKKRKDIVLSFLSLLFSFVFLLCSDARGDFGVVVLIVCLSTIAYYSKKHGIQGKKQALIIVLVCVLVLLLASATSMIADYFRYGTYYSSEKGHSLIDTFVREFGFVVRSQLKSVDVIYTKEYKWKLLDDLIGSLTCWIPDSFLPFKQPETLWAYNTILIKGETHGTLPTDIYSASLYLFGIIGPIIMPFLFGVCTRIISNRFSRIKNDNYRIVLENLFAFKLGLLSGYYMMRSFVYENFALILFLICIELFCRIKCTPNRNE